MDLSYRVIPGDTPSDALTMTHSSVHFDRTGFREDVNVVFPIDRLHELANEGVIGSVADYHYSLMGAGWPPSAIEPTMRELATVTPPLLELHGGRGPLKSSLADAVDRSERNCAEVDQDRTDTDSQQAHDAPTEQVCVCVCSRRQDRLGDGPVGAREKHQCERADPDDNPSDH